MQVNEYDCLLLEFVFGNRPDDAQKVRAYVLETIASDPGLQQTELVFLGLFGRSCRILESKDQQVGVHRPDIFAQSCDCRQQYWCKARAKPSQAEAAQPD